MLLNMVDNSYISTIFDSLDMIINSVFGIMAIFDKYAGSEFCQGLLFGVTGSNLVLNLGREILTQVENLNDLFN